MKIRKMKIFAIALAPVPLFALLGSSPAVTRAEDKPFDAAATFKARCVGCHTAKAEKHFDPSKSDDVLVQAILKGVKTEKPPSMPEYDTKGITEDQAKALVAYMKSLRT